MRPQVLTLDDLCGLDINNFRTNTVYEYIPKPPDGPIYLDVKSHSGEVFPVPDHCCIPIVIPSNEDLLRDCTYNCVVVMCVNYTKGTTKFLKDCAYYGLIDRISPNVVKVHGIEGSYSLPRTFFTNICYNIDHKTAVEPAVEPAVSALISEGIGGRATYSCMGGRATYSCMGGRGTYSGIDGRGTYIDGRVTYVGIDGRGTYVGVKKLERDAAVVEKDCEDCWTYVSQRTGVDRQTCKRCLLKMFSARDTILELAREFKLDAVTLGHINLTFGDWAGFDPDSLKGVKDKTEVNPALLEKDCDDCWTYISQQTGVDRQTCKLCLTKVLVAYNTMSEVAKEFKLDAVTLGHINKAFGDWAGFDPDSLTTRGHL